MAFKPKPWLSRLTLGLSGLPLGWGPLPAWGPQESSCDKRVASLLNKPLGPGFQFHIHKTRIQCWNLVRDQGCPAKYRFLGQVTQQRLQSRKYPEGLLRTSLDLAEFTAGNLDLSLVSSIHWGSAPL